MQGAHTCGEDVTATVGLGPFVQLSVDKLVRRESPDSAPGRTSVSPTTIGLKSNFIQKNGWAAAVYPTVSLNDATRFHQADGTLAESDGHIFYFPVMISTKVGPRTTVAANLGAGRSFERADIKTLNMSVAIGQAIGESSKVLGEFERQRASHESVNTARVAWVKLVLNKPANRYQISLSSGFARTIGYTPEGRPRYSVRIGIIIVRKSKS